jgi:hypothetical protein
VRRTDFEPGSEENFPPPTIVTARPAGRPVRIIGLAISAVSFVTLFLARERIWPRTDPAPKKIMLAVLPFENLSGDSQQDYFSSGLTEEMITHVHWTYWLGIASLVTALLWRAFNALGLWLPSR